MKSIAILALVGSSDASTTVSQHGSHQYTASASSPAYAGASNPLPPSSEIITRQHSFRNVLGSTDHNAFSDSVAEKVIVIRPELAFKAQHSREFGSYVVKQVVNKIGSLIVKDFQAGPEAAVDHNTFQFEFFQTGSRGPIGDTPFNMHLALPGSDLDATVRVSRTGPSADGFLPAPQGLSAQEFQMAIEKNIINTMAPADGSLRSLLLGYIEGLNAPLHIVSFKWLVWDAKLQRMTPDETKNPRSGGLFFPSGVQKTQAGAALSVGISFKVELDISADKKDTIDITLMNHIDLWRDLHALNRLRENSFGRSMQRITNHLAFSNRFLLDSLISPNVFTTYVPESGHLESPGLLYEALRDIKAELKKLMKKK